MRGEGDIVFENVAFTVEGTRSGNKAFRRVVGRGLRSGELPGPMCSSRAWRKKAFYDPPVNFNPIPPAAHLGRGSRTTIGGIRNSRIVSTLVFPCRRSKTSVTESYNPMTRWRATPGGNAQERRPGRFVRGTAFI